jgi:hypothetical protein
MSINLGTYALVSALAVGGAVAQHQYNKPAGPPDDMQGTQQSVQQDQLQPQNGYSSTPMGSTTTDVLDCNTLMTNHQQMMTELDRMDTDIDTRLSQMRDAKSDRAKLDATVGVVETLVTQRKQMRDREMAMHHQTLQFLFANKNADLKTSCPQMTEWLQKGSMTGTHTGHEQGGPDDMELGNDNNVTQPQQQQQQPQQPPQR